MIKLSGVCIKLDDCKEGTDGFFNMCLVLRNSLKVKKLLNENELDELYYLIDSVLDVKKIKENIMIDVRLHDKILDLYDYIIRGE